MERLVSSVRLIAAAVLAAFFTAVAAAAPTMSAPAGIDTGRWDSLLRKYVDERGLVDYGRWKSDAGDLRALDEFIAAYAPAGVPAAKGGEEIAALINAYNAFTIRWIISNYPTESIRELDDSWSASRWTIGGRKVSLDEIEHKNLRQLFGWKVHAAIVCAARSCPPLQAEAYTAGNLEKLTEQAYRAWLSRTDLTTIDEAEREVGVSEIFKWFSGDFTGDGSIREILARYGPAEHRAFLERRDYEIGYVDYHWGLNDKAGLGRDYRYGLFKRLF